MSESPLVQFLLCCVSLVAEHARVLRACFRRVWRATLRRGRAPSANGRDRSASLHNLHLLAAVGRFRKLGKAAVFGKSGKPRLKTGRPADAALPAGTVARPSVLPTPSGNASRARCVPQRESVSSPMPDINVAIVHPGSKKNKIFRSYGSSCVHCAPTLPRQIFT